MTDSEWSGDDAMQLEALEGKLGHAFSDRALLVAALTRRAFALELGKACAHNEAMEFLGDAILAFEVCDRLYRRFPGLDEGRLSRHKHLLVQASTLADCARDLELDQHVRLGGGERKAGAPNERILANVFEAVLAAVHLDGGLDAVRGLLDRVLDPRIAVLDGENPVQDWKNLLQERTQSLGLGLPVYRTVDEIGPDNQRVFHVVVEVGQEEMAKGAGGTKRAAHQLAARVALQRLDDRR